MSRRLAGIALALTIGVLGVAGSAPAAIPSQNRVTHTQSAKGVTAAKVPGAAKKHHSAGHGKHHRVAQAKTKPATK